MTYSLAPASRARTICDTSVSVVTMMIFRSSTRGRARTCSTNSSPDISGMFQSTSDDVGAADAGQYFEGLGSVAGLVELVEPAHCEALLENHPHGLRVVDDQRSHLRTHFPVLEP